MPIAPVRAMLLAGAWSPQVEADCKILARLGSEPQSVQELCASLGHQPDARLLHRRSKWTTTREPAERIFWEQPKTAWALLAPLLREVDLDRFAEVILESLTTGLANADIPSTDMPSTVVCKGLVYSLALIGNSDGLVPVTPLPSARAASIVESLLVAKNEPWIRLAEHMPLLAEAAPEGFLAALQRSLSVAGLWGENPQVQKQAARALAVLALDVDLLERAALGLAGLAEYGEKPKSNIRDSHPLQCLEEIFNFHYPKTNAPIDDRLSVLREVVRQHPRVAWPLLMELLPRQRMVALHLPLPQILRVSVPPQSRQAYPGEAYGQVQAFLYLAMEMAGCESGRWADLIQHLWMIPEELKIEVLNQLEAVADQLLDSEALVWNALRTLLHIVEAVDEPEGTQDNTDEREDRILRKQALLLAERLYEKLTPDDPAIRYTWLFSTKDGPPGRFRGFEEERQEIQKRQKICMAEIGRLSDRWNVLSKLADRVEQPYWLIHALFWSDWASEFEDKLLSSNTFVPYSVIAPHFLAMRLIDRDFSESTTLLHGLVTAGRYEDASKLAVALTGSADERESWLWDFLERLGQPVLSLYWQALPLMNLYGQTPRNVNNTDRAIRHFLQCQRFDDASRAAVLLKAPASSGLILDVLSEIVQRTQEHDRTWQAEYDRLAHQGDISALIEYSFSRDRHGIVDKHGVAELLKKVQPDGTVQIERALKYEQALLRLIEDTRYELRWLPRHLGAHPQAFVELVQSTDADALLELWGGFPGDDLSTQQAQTLFYQWSKNVLALLPEGQARRAGRTALARLLIRPNGADGIWPSEVVRRLLEEYPELYADLLAAKAHPNRRRMRRVDEIVREAHELAEICREASKRLKDLWPATGKFLLDLAREYDGQVELHNDRGDLHSLRDNMTSSKVTIQPLFPLLRVSIENFRAIKQLDLKLHPRLTVLYGRNASGKTAVLDAVAIGLGAIARRLPSANDDVEQSLPRFRERDRHTLWQEGKKVEKAKRVSVSLWGQPQGNRNNPLHWFVENRWASRGPEISDREGPELQLYLDGVNESLRTSDDTVPMPVFAYYGVERAVSEQAKENARPPRETPSRPVGLDGALQGVAKFEQAVTWFRALEDIEVRRQRDKRSYEMPALAAIRKAVSSAVKTTDGAQVRNIRIDAESSKLRVDFVRTDGSVQELEMGQLSDGFRTQLALVMDLALRMVQCNPPPDGQLERDGFGTESYAVVLIDQVDQNLHPGWQQTVLRGLLSAFPNTQFIITTHSVLVLGSAKDAHVLLLRDGVAETVDHLFGKDSNTLLREYQQITPRDQAVQGDIEEAMKMLDEENFTEAKKKIENLEKQLGSDDSDVVHLRTVLYFADPPPEQSLPKAASNSAES